jgi:hypothetical protein
MAERRLFVFSSSSALVQIAAHRTHSVHAPSARERRFNYFRSFNARHGDCNELRPRAA